MDIFEIQSRLKFISNVQIGDKINVKFMLIQKDCLSTKISRTLYYETRQNTLNFVRDTINRALEILGSSPCCSKDKETMITLLSDIKKSKIGIQNLRETYMIDVKFCCDLDTILENITIKIHEYEPHYGTSMNTMNTTNMVINNNGITVPRSIPLDINSKLEIINEGPKSVNSHSSNEVYGSVKNH
jgi:hypothetical protein